MDSLLSTQDLLVTLFLQEQLSTELKIAFAIAVIPAIISFIAQIAGVYSSRGVSSANAAGMTVEAALSISDRWEREANRLYQVVDSLEEEYKIEINVEKKDCNERIKQIEAEYNRQFDKALDLIEELINGNIANAKLFRKHGIEPAYEKKGSVVRGDYKSWLNLE